MVPFGSWKTNSITPLCSTWAGNASWEASNFPNKPVIISETGAGGIYGWFNGTSVDNCKYVGADRREADVHVFEKEGRAGKFGPRLHHFLC